MSGRAGRIDNLLQSGGRARRRTKRRTKCTYRKRKQRGRGIKKKIAGKILSLAAQNANKGLNFLSKRIKNKKLKAILDSDIVKSVVDKGSNYAKNRGDRWYNEN